MLEEYKAANQIHCEKFRRRRKLAFIALKTPSQKAQYSIPQFLRKYFLAQDGSPQRRKTPEPLALHISSHRRNFLDAMRRVPGLYTASSGSEWDGVLFVGWNHTAVQRAARPLRPGPRSPFGGRSIAALELPERHLSEPPREEIREFKLENAIGSYRLKHYKYPDGTGYFGQPLQLNIYSTYNGGLQAAFDVGDLTGVMLLAADPYTLRRMKAKAEKGEKSASHNGGRHNDENGGESNQNSDDDKEGGEENNDTGEAPSGSSTGPYRLRLRWRGREIREDVIDFDHRGREDDGYIDFRDAGCTRIGGCVESDSDAGGSFRGRRTGPPSTFRKGTWQMYSEKQYDFENRDRWRR